MKYFLIKSYAVKKSTQGVKQNPFLYFILLNIDWIKIAFQPGRVMVLPYFII